MVPTSLRKIIKSRFTPDSFSPSTPRFRSPLRIPLAMNPTHQHAPTPKELCLAAVEQALIDSEAREIDTKNQFTALLSGFRQLELLMQEMNPTNTPKTPPTDTIPVRLTVRATCKVRGDGL